MSITGDADGEPRKVGVALVDVMAGLHAAIGILAAVHHRDRTGEGQLVEVDLLSTTLFALANQASNWLTAGVVPGRMGNRHPSHRALRDVPRLGRSARGRRRERRAVRVVRGRARVPPRSRTTIGSPRTPRGSRTATTSSPRSRIASRTTRPAAWVDRLTRSGIPCGVVNQVDDAFALAASVGSSPVATIERPDGTAVATTANPLALTATPVSYRAAPPRMGADDDEIRAWLDREAADG